MNPAHPYRRFLVCLFLCALAPCALAKGEQISVIHLVLNSLSSGGNWWGVTEVYVWDEKGKIVGPLKIDAKQPGANSNSWDRATGALHVIRINDALEHTGWVPKTGGQHYDNSIGAAMLNIHLPRSIRGGTLAVATWEPSKKLPSGKRSAGIATGRMFFRYGGATTFHEFSPHPNPGGAGAPIERFVHATHFGEAPKRRSR